MDAQLCNTLTSSLYGQVYMSIHYSYDVFPVWKLIEAYYESIMYNAIYSLIRCERVGFCSAYHGSFHTVPATGKITVLVHVFLNILSCSALVSLSAIPLHHCYILQYLHVVHVTNILLCLRLQYYWAFCRRRCPKKYIRTVSVPILVQCSFKIIFKKTQNIRIVQ